ncbi:hypothetical protein B0H14DRAFT_2652317 [Mycena olivaceomarginata]|nr:hypothetical protein B0H14DRAFT_2652317 [Mycena olivaceomarginata]
MSSSLAQPHKRAEEDLTKPCKRCIQKGLHCQYFTVADEQYLSSKNTSSSNGSTSFTVRGGLGPQSPTQPIRKFSSRGGKGHGSRRGADSQLVPMAPRGMVPTPSGPQFNMGGTYHPISPALSIPATNPPYRGARRYPHPGRHMRLDLFSSTILRSVLLGIVFARPARAIATVVGGEGFRV